MWQSSTYGDSVISDVESKPEWLKAPIKMIQYRILEEIIYELGKSSPGLMFIKGHYQDLFNIQFGYNPNARELLSRTSVLEKVEIGQLIAVLNQIDKSNLSSKIQASTIRNKLNRSKGTYVNKLVKDLDISTMSKVYLHLSPYWREFASLIGMDSYDTIAQCQKTMKPVQEIMFKWKHKDEATIENLGNAFNQLGINNACVIFHAYKKSNQYSLGIYETEEDEQNERDLELRIVKNQKCSIFKYIFCC